MASGLIGALIGSIGFSTPRRSRILLLDTPDSPLRKLVLEGLDYAFLDCVRDLGHLAPVVLLRMVKNIVRVDWRYVFYCLRKGSLGGLFNQLYMVYLLSCVEYIDPKVVITFLDNSWFFHAISRIHRKAEFFAVQNGGRSIGCVSVSLPPAPNPAHHISMPHLFCFGEYEADLYGRYGHKIDHFHPVGPLIGSYYLSQRSPVPAIDFDLCLVSQWRAGYMRTEHNPGMRRMVETLDDFLARYVKERSLRLCVAACGSDPLETKHFVKTYGASAHIVPSDREKMSTYGAMDRSAVIVAVCSTASLEALGWGKKVLFCNLLADPASYMPAEGIWSLTEASYDKFKKKLDYLRALSDDEYRRVSGKFASHAVHYDLKTPAHQSIRKMLVAAAA